MIQHQVRQSSSRVLSKRFSKLLCLQICCTNWQKFTTVHVCGLENSRSDASNLSFLQKTNHNEWIHHDEYMCFGLAQVVLKYTFTVHWGDNTVYSKPANLQSMDRHKAVSKLCHVMSRDQQHAPCRHHHAYLRCAGALTCLNKLSQRELSSALTSSFVRSLTYLAGLPAHSWPEGIRRPGGSTVPGARTQWFSTRDPSMRTHFSPISTSSSTVALLKRQPCPMVTYLPTVVAADRPVGDVLFAHVAQGSQKSMVHKVHGIPGNTSIKILLCCEMICLTAGIKRAIAKQFLCCSIPQTGANTAKLLSVRLTAP